MSSELDRLEENVALAGETMPEIEGERDRSKFVDGEWVSKERVDPVHDEDRPHCEFLDGVWVEKGMSNAGALVEAKLIWFVNNFVIANRLGFVFSESSMYELFAERPKHWRRPDLSFVSYEERLELSTQWHC